MDEIAFAIFDTPIGLCASAWSDHGIKALSLPEQSEAALRKRFARRFPESREMPPTPIVAAAIARIRALLEGGRDDLATVVLDMEGEPEFHRRVYELARTIPPGEIRTYGDIAADLGDKTLSRAVGQALGRNPWPIVVPCHRVLAANGKTGGFSADGGVETKMRMLTIERAGTSAAPSLFADLPLAARPRR